MDKILTLLSILLVVLVVDLSAQVDKSNRTRVLLQAEEIYGKSDVIYAKGNIRLEYQEMLMIADFANYDKAKGVLTIYGSVSIVNSNGSVVKTDRIILEVDSDNIVFEKFLFVDERKMWLRSETAKKEKECYNLKNAAFSTCALNNPDWHLGFSEAKYNAKTKYIKLKDTKFYIGQTPVFYFPYLAFSTSKERSSGLLMPKFGYNSKEGLLYEQPIYWAISPSVDLEFNPQARTNRGGGLYATLRFADSNHSEGMIRAGYFSDSQEYAEENNLKNDSHYGIEAIYSSSDLLGGYKPDGYSDALYMNILSFNDIDYLNLQKDRLYHLSDSYLKESRINYMIYNQDNYLGLNAKYFKDAKKDSNADTLQELPTLRWHRYISSFSWLPDLSYSIDVKISNHTRKTGSISKQAEIEIPSKYNLSLLDDYLKIELGEKLYLYKGDFDKTESGIDGYSAAMLTQSIKLYSDLANMYEDGIHTVQWSAIYEKQHHIGDGLIDYNSLDISTQRDFVPQKPFDERITLQFGQFWYMNGNSLTLRHRVSQAYYPSDDEKWGDLRHELDLNYDEWSISNLFMYSFEHNALSELSNTLSYTAEKLKYNIRYHWRKDLELDKIITNEIAFGGSYRYSSEVKLFADITYDIESGRSKRYSGGIRYDKGCWATEFSYRHDTEPILEADGGGYVNNDTFLLKISLVPFGESEIRQ